MFIIHAEMEIDDLEILDDYCDPDGETTTAIACNSHRDFIRAIGVVVESLVQDMSYDDTTTTQGKLGDFASDLQKGFNFAPLGKRLVIY